MATRKPRFDTSYSVRGNADEEVFGPSKRGGSPAPEATPDRAPSPASAAPVPTRSTPSPSPAPARRRASVAREVDIAREGRTALAPSEEPSGVASFGDARTLPAGAPDSPVEIPAIVPLGALRRTQVRDPRGDGPTQATEVVQVGDLSAVGSAKGPPAAIPLTVRQKAKRIVEELERCGPGDESMALKPLERLGEAGLDAIYDGFPGLPWFNRHLPYQTIPSGEKATPLCWLLVKIGEPSRPIVTRLLDDPDPDRRFYALMVAEALDPAAFVDAFARASIDEEPPTRELGLRALGSLGGSPARARAEAGLAHLVSTAAAPRDARLRAVAALGHLRSGRAVPALFGLLDDVDDIGLAEGAHRVLRVITARDEGRSSTGWKAWWSKAAKYGRIEWLLDALAQKDRTLASLADDELAGSLGEPTSYDPSGSIFARRKALKRIRLRAREKGLLL